MKANDMGHSFTDRLSEYLDEEMSAGERASIEAHLATCASCRATLAELRAVTAKAASLTDLPPASDLWSGIAARIERDSGSSSTVRPFFKREPRFVRVDGYSLEALPQGWILVFANLDVPGVIGRIGTLCGRHGINIAGMQLGRERPGGRAVSLLNLDDPMPPAALEEIRAMSDIVLAKLVRL